MFTNVFSSQMTFQVQRMFFYIRPMLTCSISLSGPIHDFELPQMGIESFKNVYVQLSINLWRASTFPNPTATITGWDLFSLP